jgi:hypothetical protein
MLLSIKALPFASFPHLAVDLNEAAMRAQMKAITAKVAVVFKFSGPDMI